MKQKQRSPYAAKGSVETDCSKAFVLTHITYSPRYRAKTVQIALTMHS